MLISVGVKEQSVHCSLSGRLQEMVQTCWWKSLVPYSYDNHMWPRFKNKLSFMLQDCQSRSSVYKMKPLSLLQTRSHRASCWPVNTHLSIPYKHHHIKLRVWNVLGFILESALLRDVCVCFGCCHQSLSLCIRRSRWWCTWSAGSRMMLRCQRTRPSAPYAISCAPSGRVRLLCVQLPLTQWRHKH